MRLSISSRPRGQTVTPLIGLAEGYNLTSALFADANNTALLNEEDIMAELHEAKPRISHGIKHCPEAF